MATFVRKQQSWVVVTETVWLAKPEIFTIWFFTVASCWVRHIFSDTQPHSPPPSSVGHPRLSELGPLEPACILSVGEGLASELMVPRTGPAALQAAVAQQGHQNAHSSPERRGGSLALIVGTGPSQISQESSSLLSTLLGVNPLAYSSK